MYPTLYHFFLDTFGISIEWLKSIYTLGFFISLAWLTSGYLFFKLSDLPSLDKIRLIGVAIGASWIGALALGYIESSGTYHSHSGYTYYGGLLLAFGAGYLILRLTQKPIVPTLNAAAIPLFAGYGIGRLGCHFSGDGDWGIPNPYANSTWLPDWLWKYDYPGNALGFYNEEPIRFLENFPYETEFSYALQHPVFPTPVYEVILAVMGVSILIWLKKQPRFQTLLFPFFLVLSSTFRFGIEWIRNTPKYDIGIPLSASQIIALLLLGIGLLWLFRDKKQRKESKQRIVND